MNKRDKLRDDLLIKQEGKCPLCKKGPWCAACGIEVSDIDIEILGKGKCRFFHKGHSKHHVQMVNTLDHNHSHKECKGCEKCARGMTHDRCNRAINLIFEGKSLDHIQDIVEYVKLGFQND